MPSRAFRRIGRCTACKATSARDYVETRQETRGVGMFARIATVFGRVVCGRWCPASQDAECPRCGRAAWNGKAVVGFTTAHQCNASCTEAKGFNCECSCGGANHGKGWLVCETVREVA